MQRDEEPEQFKNWFPSQSLVLAVVVVSRVLLFSAASGSSSSSAGFILSIFCDPALDWRDVKIRIIIIIIIIHI